MCPQYPFISQCCRSSALVPRLLLERSLDFRPFRERQEQLRPNHEPIAGAGRRYYSRSPCGRGTVSTNAFTSAAGSPIKAVNFELVSELIGVMTVAEVRLQEGESIENALRRFKRKV